MTTAVDVRDLRVEKQYPYMGNIQGERMEDLLVRIDAFLKDASPDAMAPGLINWGHKDLFLEKWIRQSGTGDINHNPFGASKIGKGRYEITGTGVWEFDRLLAVSEVRGVAARIFIGATQAGAEVSVGVMCYDADQNLLGTNGGFVFDHFIPDVNVYTYNKSSCFGESFSGVRFLKPNTRFVKFYVEVHTNPNVVFFDESEMTVFEQDERYKQIFSNVVNWNESEFFYTELTADTTFEFKNDHDGRVKNMIIKNVGGSNLNVTFPNSKWQGGVPLTMIRPGRTTIFTWIKAGGSLYGAAIEEME